VSKKIKKGESKKMSHKIASILKGANLATLLIAGILLAMALSGNPILVLSAAAGLAGWLMVGNSIVELLELIFVNPGNHVKLYSVYKTISLVLSVAVALFLLTALIANPMTAMVSAVVVIFLLAIVDGIEAWLL
jgi:hypothetical protein